MREAAILLHLQLSLFFFWSAVPASGNALVFQIGANATQQISVHIDKMSTDALGVKDANGIVANQAIKDIDVRRETWLV